MGPDNYIPQYKFWPGLLLIHSQNLSCYDWLSVPESSGIIHSVERIYIHYWHNKYFVERIYIHYWHNKYDGAVKD